MFKVLTAILIGFTVIMGIQTYNGTPQEKAQQFLEDHGYSQIEITGMRWFGCANYRIFNLPVAFTASINNQKVTGVVCFRSIVTEDSVPLLSLD